MFVSPLLVPQADARVHVRAGRRARRAPGSAHRVLVAWLLVGSAIASLVPAIQPGALLGWTPAFWLVGAPLLDLAWLHRARLARAASLVARRLRTPAPAPARRVVVRAVAQRAPGRRALRSSRT